VVPADHYFVMGDNRDNSQDSRWWGFLPRHYIKGKALMVYWSYEAEEQYSSGDGLMATIRDTASLVVQFFTKTRWSRLFHQIR